ncbi:MAG: amino acid adenylation domain-containing protein [Anaerolineales bacterium]|nr:amino acid adenylation domain-containing protein [Anaerolineales bacterium]
MTTVEPDLIVFDRKMIASRDFWLEKLSSGWNNAGIRPDFPRPGNFLYVESAVPLDIEGEAYQRLIALTNGGPFLIYTTLMAVLSIYLYKYTGQEAIIIGSPNRQQNSHSAGKSNVVPIISPVNPAHSFKEFLLAVRHNLLEAYQRQSYPYAHLVRALGVASIENKNPLFDTALLLREIHDEMPAVRQDLTIVFSLAQDALRGQILFNQNLFRNETITAFADQFTALLQNCLTNTDSPIASLQMMPAAAAAAFLAKWNRPAITAPSPQCIHHLFEHQATRRPNHPAVIDGKEKLTYQDVNRRANQLAHTLRTHGVGPDKIVGLYVERSPEMIIGMLGILKAGGAYLPLSPTAPPNRLTFMLQDTQAVVLLTQESLLATAPDYAGAIICLDRDWDEIAGSSDTNPTSDVHPHNLVYVIYTSGSTGRPKGVMIEHDALVNFTQAATAAYGINEQDRVLQFASLSFDAAAEEIYPCFSAGATLVLRTREMLDSATDFIQRSRDWGLTVWDLPTAYWHQLADELAAGDLTLPDTLRLVIIGGEAALADRLRTWRADIGPYPVLLNSYGTTEATIVSTVCNLSEYTPATHTTTAPPIGRPLDNAQIFVLNVDRQVVPVGVPGELCIGGASLARGYLNNLELTERRFIPHPFDPRPGARLYRTGDHARYLPDGNVEFLGRVDHQVKIRGFRIELGEIEAVLTQHALVQDVVVTAQENELNHDKQLVAYVVPATPDLKTCDLQRYMEDRLPDYMVPARMMLLETFPLTSGGKIDRRNLPKPEDIDLSTHYVAPRHPVEELLASVWADVLGISQVGVNDDFFALGGHSLLATQIVSRIKGIFEIELPLRTLFETTTIASLAQALLTRESSPGQLEMIARLHQQVNALTEAEVAAMLQQMHHDEGVAV